MTVPSSPFWRMRMSMIRMMPGVVEPEELADALAGEVLCPAGNSTIT